jgi:hypothetical protein
MSESVQYSGWPQGMDNRRSDFDIPKPVLRNGVNVDILSSGRVRRRRGIAQAIADPGAHSVFSDGVRLVWATANKLKTAIPPNFTASVLLTDARLAGPLSYAVVNGEIYFSNELVNGKINAAGTYEAWGIIPPAFAPTLSATAGTRIVQVNCVFVTATGEESGAPAVASVVSCGDTPSILATNIPQSGDSRVVATRLYATTLDGTALYAEADIPVGVTSYTLTGFFGRGEMLKTQGMFPPPPGQLLDYYNGKIYIAADKVIWNTQPLRYGICDYEHDFLMYPARVTLLKSVTDGQYVSSDQTYFLPQIGTDAVENRDLLPYKAIEGAAMTLPDSKDVIWLSERGFVRGTAGGGMKNLTEGQIAVDRFTRACIGTIEREGHKAVVAIAKTGTVNPLTSSDYRAAEARRTAEVQ